MMLSKAEEGPCYYTTSTSTSSPSTLSMPSSAGRATVTRAKTTVEREVYNNSLITSGSFIFMDEESIFRTHSHLPIERQKCMHKVGKLPTSTLSSSAEHATIHRSGTTIERELTSNTPTTGGSFVFMDEGNVFQAHTHLPSEGRKSIRKVGKRPTSILSLSADHTTINRPETTVERRLTSNTPTTGGSSVSLDESNVFQTHTHLLTERRKGMHKVGKRPIPILPLSVGHATINRSGTTVERELTSNTPITGGSSVSLDESNVLQTHTHLSTEGRRGMRKVGKRPTPILSLSAGHATIDHSGTTVEWGLTSNTPTTGGSDVSVGESNIFQTHTHLPTEGRKSMRDVGKRPTPMLSPSADHATMKHPGTTAERELTSNTSITGGSDVSMDESNVFQTHTHLPTEGRKGVRKVHKRSPPILSLSADHATRNCSGITVERELTSNTPTTGGSSVSVGESNVFQTHTRLPHEGRKDMCDVDKRPIPILSPSTDHATINCGGTTVEQELSSDTLITGGTFVNVEEGGVFNQTHARLTTEGSLGIRKLAKMTAPGAFHNSAERYDPPKCHPKTRIAVLKKIMDWVQGLEDSEKRCYFMWLYGPAGVGKSAIAQTIAELCYELKLLAASFFFSRTAAGRNDDSRLIATLTYQLCLSIPEIRTYVEDAVELDPNIFSLSLENQLRKLIIEPLSHLHHNPNQYHGSTHPRFIIIDGLDECSSATFVQRYVLQILADNLPVPMLFLVASRPEPHIRRFFTAEPMASITTTLALDDSYLPYNDIRVFLKAKFDAIKRDHPLGDQLPKSWPSIIDVDRLVHRSSGQFIYASTVMKYIESPRHWPTDRLRVIFGIMNRGNDTPFADIDALYTYIFSSVADINRVLEVFGVLLLDQTSILQEGSVIEDLLSLRRGDLKITLMDLHSILDIPDAGEIRILHASLGDFLLDPTRSGIYHINQGHAHANLARHLMRCIPQKVTGSHEIDILHGLSSIIFPVHCARSYPTAELVDALWNIDLSAFWALYYAHRNNPFGDPFAMYDVTSLADFFIWLKNDGSIRQGQDLYSHYMLSWDRYIRLYLTQLSLGPLESQCIVFFILPQIRHNYQAQHVFTTATVYAECCSLWDVSLALEVHNLDGKYDLLLEEFFSDPSRSGSFYVDGDKYTSFALTFTRYLIHCGTLYPISERRSNWERDSRSLSILLPKASYSEELATLLNSKILSRIEIERPDLEQNLADVVKTYCDREGRAGNSTRGLQVVRWFSSKFHGIPL